MLAQSTEKRMKLLVLMQLTEQTLYFLVWSTVTAHNTEMRESQLVVVRSTGESAYSALLGGQLRLTQQSVRSEDRILR